MITINRPANQLDPTPIWKEYQEWQEERAKKPRLRWRYCTARDAWFASNVKTEECWRFPDTDGEVDEDYLYEFAAL